MVDYHENQFLELQNKENKDRVLNSEPKITNAPTNVTAFDRYAYSLNNPLRYTDPSGHCIEDLCIGETIFVLVVFGIATVAAVDMIQPGKPEAFAQSMVDLGDQVIDTFNGLIQNASDRALISQKDLLPKSGEMPYTPPKQKGNPPFVRSPQGGFVDKDGNIWTRDKSQHGGPHWDVELPNGKHLNVDDDGKIIGGSAK